MNARFSYKLLPVNFALVAGIILLIVALSIAFQYYKASSFGQEASQSSKAEIQHNRSLETIFVPAINQRLKRDNIKELKSETIPAGAKEVRVWSGFSHDGFSGLILRNNDEAWSVIYVPGYNEDSPSSSAPRLLSSPKNGWQKLSYELQQLGIYDLPGEPDNVSGRLSIHDAISVVIEVKTSESYRVGKYRGLLYYQDEGIKKVERIINLLSEEFGVKLY